MRDLIVSTAAVILLIAVWVLFFNFSAGQVDSITSDIYDNLLPMVEEENWDDSKLLVQDISERWQHYRKIALHFTDNDSLNEIDFALSKSSKYIKAEDVSNSSGELLALYRQLTFLNSEEKINFVNIF